MLRHGVGVEFKLTGLDNNSHRHVPFLMAPLLFFLSFNYKSNFNSMFQIANLCKAVLSFEIHHADISSLRNMEEYALYSEKRECSQMFEYGKYVTECMFYENDREVDLEGRDTGVIEISRNTLLTENVCVCVYK